MQPNATGESKQRRRVGSDTGTTASILIVEDDTEHKDAVALCLLAAGYKNVRTEESCDAALEVIRQSSPDLMILDINLGGMNGLEFLEQMKSDLSLPHFPVIVLTGRQDCERQATDLGVTGYLAKPLQVHRLVALVDAALGRHGG